jgi:hypothetical protein
MNEMNDTNDPFTVVYGRIWGRLISGSGPINKSAVVLSFMLAAV